MILYIYYLRILKAFSFSIFYRTVIVLSIFIGITRKINANPAAQHSLLNIRGLPSIVCTSPLSYYVDRTRKLSFNDIRNKTFSTKIGGLSQAVNKYYERVNYWMKFSLENIDSLPAVAFLDAGYFRRIQIDEIAKGKIKVLDRNMGTKKIFDTPHPELYTTKLLLPPNTTVHYFIRLSSTADYGVAFDQVNIFSREALFDSFYHNYYENRTFRLLQILFLGFMLSQMLYVGFSRVIGIKRKEYLYYLFYLVLVMTYYVLKYDNVIGIYWPFVYYPKIIVYSKSILLALPYLFYMKFIQYFLNLKELDEKVFNKFYHLEYFIGIYVFIDTLFRFLLPNPGFLTEILMIVIFAVFIYGLILILPLIRYKRLLINLIIIGSLIAGFGGVIGMMVSLLQNDLGILHTDINTLISGQVGIVIETIIFTTALSIKTRMMEREKIVAQEKLITQLEENALLKNKMEKTRNKIAQDLHDDIGSTLSSILLFSNAGKTKFRFKNGEANDIFSKISKIAGNMMDEMSDIIWAINPIQDSMDKVLKRMHYYAAPLANAQNIQFDFKADNDIKHLHLSMEKRKNLFLIFKESVINAIKYSEGTFINVKLYRNNSNLHMKVKDNGKGFSHHSEHGNGLGNMKVRAEDTGGNLEIKSREKEGTLVHLIMPL